MFVSALSNSRAKSLMFWGISKGLFIYLFIYFYLYMFIYIYNLFIFIFYFYFLFFFFFYFKTILVSTTQDALDLTHHQLFQLLLIQTTVSFAQANYQALFLFIVLIIVIIIILLIILLLLLIPRIINCSV